MTICGNQFLYRWGGWEVESGKLRVESGKLKVDWFVAVFAENVKKADVEDINFVLFCRISVFLR